MRQGDVIVIIGVGRRLPFFSRLVDVMLEHGLTVVVIGDISARNAVIGRNVAFFKVVLNSHVLTSFTAAFALIADGGRSRKMPRRYRRRGARAYRRHQRLLRCAQ